MYSTSPVQMSSLQLCKPRTSSFAAIIVSAYTFPMSTEMLTLETVIWQSELPTWVTSPNVTWTNETLTAVLRNHVKTLVSYFGDNCYSWDVVNEALSDNPAGAWQSNIWYDTIGSNYVAYAFAAAQEAVQENNLKVKLYCKYEVGRAYSRAAELLWVAMTANSHWVGGL